jgi:hypothetical protein
LLGTYCGSNASTKVVVLSSTNSLLYTSCQILEIMQEVLKIFLLFMHNIMLRIREVGIVVFVIN